MTFSKFVVDFIFFIGFFVFGVLDDFIGIDNVGMILCFFVVVIVVVSCFFFFVVVERVDR